MASPAIACSLSAADYRERLVDVSALVLTVRAPDEARPIMDDLIRSFRGARLPMDGWARMPLTASRAARRQRHRVHRGGRS